MRICISPDKGELNYESLNKIIEITGLNYEKEYFWNYSFKFEFDWIDFWSYILW